MPILIDTHVLIYALRSPKKSDSQELKDFAAAAKWVLDNNKKIVLSAISYFEVLRGLKPSEAAALEQLQSRFHIEAITIGVVDAAHTLLQKRGQTEGTCSRCLGAKMESPCKDCKRSISRQQRLNDALIVATAATAPGISLAFSEDSGVLSLAEHSTVQFQRLPNPHGPLFEKKKKR